MSESTAEKLMTRILVIRVKVGNLQGVVSTPKLDLYKPDLKRIKRIFEKLLERGKLDADQARKLRDELDNLAEEFTEIEQCLCIEA